MVTDASAIRYTSDDERRENETLLSAAKRIISEEERKQAEQQSTTASKKDNNGKKGQNRTTSNTKLTQTTPELYLVSFLISTGIFILDPPAVFILRNLVQFCHDQMMVS